MSELALKLKEQDIETHPTKRGDSLGISFKAKAIAFSGKDLGRGYTFPGLIKHQGVKYDEERDRPTLEMLPKLPPIDTTLLIALRQIELSEKAKKDKKEKNKSQLFY